MRTDYPRVLAFALLAGCSAGAHQAPAGAKADDGPILLTADDDGSTVPVLAGQTLVVSLQQDPTSGYSWVVTLADAGLSDPTQVLATGDAGTQQQLTWETDEMWSGAYTIELDYLDADGNPSDPPQTFTFTASIEGHDPGDDAEVRYAMPQPIVSFERVRDWGLFHLGWHTMRRWDSLSKASLKFAQSKGWTRAQRQEGDTGNGLDFLAMHHMMLQTLRERFPANASLFEGWSSPPTDPKDAAQPVPGGAAFDPRFLAALDRLENDLDGFASMDELGLFIQTSLRAAGATAPAGSGVHNYLHNRWSDSKSPINLGDPSVNLENQLFWRLHGWIDKRFDAYRAKKGIGDSDPTFAAAMKAAMDEMPDQPVAGAAAALASGGNQIPPDLRTNLFSQP
jgi:predicted secreted protein